MGTLHLGLIDCVTHTVDLSFRNFLKLIIHISFRKFLKLTGVARQMLRIPVSVPG